MTTTTTIPSPNLRVPDSGGRVDGVNVFQSEGKEAPSERLEGETPLQRPEESLLEGAQHRLQLYKEKYNYGPPKPRSLDDQIHCGDAPDYVDYFQLGSDNRSRSDEDVRVYGWFFSTHDRTKAPPKGTYVELGAYDGVKESNTRFFDERLGWDGLLLEGNLKMVSPLRMNRPHAHRLYFAPSCPAEKRNDTVTFHQHIFSNTGMKGYARGYELDNRTEVEVPCGPLTPVLEDFFSSGRINFFSLDVEGNEMLVLKTIEFDRIQRDVLIVESINFFGKVECAARDQVRDYMKAAGYRLFIDGIFHSDLFLHP